MNTNGSYDFAQLSELSGVPEDRLRVLYHLYESHFPDGNPRFNQEDAEYFKAFAEATVPDIPQVLDA